MSGVELTVLGIAREQFTEQGEAVVGVSPADVASDVRGRERSNNALVVMETQSHLLQVVRTLDSPCRFASRLHRRQKEPDQAIGDFFRVRDRGQQRRKTGAKAAVE